MMSKQQIFRQIRELHKPPPAEPVFVVDGRYYKADGVYIPPDVIARHAGPIYQFYLIGEPKPEQIPGAEMVPVDGWLQADELARRTMSKEAFKQETSFGYVLKTLMADCQVPKFVVVKYC
jgi:hypothetical protein